MCTNKSTWVWGVASQWESSLPRQTAGGGEVSLAVADSKIYHTLGD